MFLSIRTTRSGGIPCLYIVHIGKSDKNETDYTNLNIIEKWYNIAKPTSEQIF